MLDFVTNRCRTQFRDQSPGEIGRLLANLRDRGRFQQASAAQRSQREDYVRRSPVMSDQGSVVVGEKAKRQRVSTRDT